jgi:hypothetical protein
VTGAAEILERGPRAWRHHVENGRGHASSVPGPRYLAPAVNLRSGPPAG